MINRRTREYEVVIFDEDPELVNAITQACYTENRGVRVFGTSSPAIALSSIVGGLFKQNFVYDEKVTIVASDSSWGIYFLREARKRCSSVHTVLLSGKMTAREIQGLFDEKLLCHFVAKDGYLNNLQVFVQKLSETIIKMTRHSYSGNVPIGHGWHAYRAFIRMWIRSRSWKGYTPMLNFEGKIVKATEFLTNPVLFEQLFLRSGYCR